MLNYCLSQPNTLEKLKDNFHYIIFPFYIFKLDHYSSSIRTSYMIIDFINLVIHFYHKEKLIKGVAADLIDVK